MKKSNFIIIIILMLGLIFLVFQDTSKAEDNIDQESLSNKIIRFHVIANSDSDKDQNLKLKVRDKILEYMRPQLNECTSIEESRKILQKNDDEIVKLAEEVIVQNGYHYKVKTTLSKEYFPIKSYGNITLPQGKYEAYRVIIGNGEGKNWWCVMFPPLCFTDITRCEVSEKQNEKKMKEILSKKEYELIDNESPDPQKIIIKLKTTELLKRLNSIKS